MDVHHFTNNEFLEGVYSDLQAANTSLRGLLYVLAFDLPNEERGMTPTTKVCKQIRDTIEAIHALQLQMPAVHGFKDVLEEMRIEVKKEYEAIK